MKMKVFALQVIGLIAMLPVVAILELNHVPLHQSTSPECVNTITTVPGKATGIVSDEALNIALETFLFTITW